MKRIFFFSLFLLLSVTIMAQTQQGVVKTRGRMVNGVLQKGTPLAGATVQVKDRSAVVSRQDGTFAFPMPGSTFLLQSVRKQGYQLVDADAVARPYQFSPNPIYLVMETPEQQMEDLLVAQEQISQGLTRRYHESLAANKRLKEENRITQEEYQRNLQRIINEQQNSSKMVKSMAEHYAKVDYDQLDEFGQRISHLILNGELSKADSMLATKGDLTVRAANVRKEWQVLNEEKAGLQQRRQETEQAREHLRKQLEELAADCYTKYEIFSMQFVVDSAMHYLRQRSELDTLNLDWMYDYAHYCYDQNYYSQAIAACQRMLPQLPYGQGPDVKNLLGIIFYRIDRDSEAIAYFKEVLELRRRQYAEDSGTAGKLATALMNLGNCYKSNKQIEDAELLYLESLALKRQLAKDIDGQEDVAVTLHNLGTLYAIHNRFDKAKATLQEGLDIYRRCVTQKPDEREYQSYMAQLLRYLGAVNEEMGQREEGEQMVQEAVDIFRRLSDENPQKYDMRLDETLSTLATFYRESQRKDDYERVYLQKLDIQRRYARQDTLLYGARLVTTLDTLATIYANGGQREAYVAILKEKLHLCRYLFKSQPQRYRPVLAANLFMLANGVGEYQLKDALAYCRESASLYEQLAKDDPQQEYSWAYVLKALGDYCSDDSLSTEAEQCYLQSIKLFRRQPDQSCVIHPLVIALYNLGLLYYEEQQWEKSLKIFCETKDVYKELAAQNPEKYTAELIGTQRVIANVHARLKDYASAAALHREMLETIAPTTDATTIAKLYNDLAWYTLFLRDYPAAEGYARKALLTDNTLLMAYANLASALLLQGKTDDAIAAIGSLEAKQQSSLLEDLAEFEKEGMIPASLAADVERMKRVLNKE